jgi:DNA-binding response OmpR family regulator
VALLTAKMDGYVSRSNPMLQALLLSRDQDVVRTMRRAFETVSVGVSVVTASDQALESINKQKFDAVLVDIDDVHDGSNVIPRLRAGKSNQRSIVFAITNGITNVKAAFEMGANFVLDKPVSFERAARSLRAAHGLILRERRRYFRVPVALSADVSFGNANIQAPVTNISEGGLSLKMERNAAAHGAVTIRLTLPKTSRPLELKGEFVAANRGANLGVKFHNLPPEVRVQLHAWLNRQIEEATPLRTGGRR